MNGESAFSKHRKSQEKTGGKYAILWNYREYDETDREMDGSMVEIGCVRTKNRLSPTQRLAETGIPTSFGVGRNRALGGPRLVLG